MAKSSKKQDKEPMKLFYLFYTRERWENWIRTLEELYEGADPDAEEQPEIMSALSNFTEDVTVSVLKIVKLFENKRFDREEALNRLNEVEAIIMEDAPESSIQDVIEAIQLPLLALFLACKKFINGEYQGEVKILVKEGRAVAGDDLAAALDIAGNIGALVIGGESCCGKYLRDEMADPGIFDEWLVEIETINEAMKSLKKFDEEPGEGS
jgi:hypothetical protein